ncbi:MAG: undecaprenyldiphospho-muramoylpentapeptide beta-N-acetylglucosaminyltransferase [Flavobacteriales bacterium]|nr:undecaprenyldiphospho-muramoylpentapeptide beta-N-acetylglucosaminyltransferase [Flavobacteriales bacterium]
MATLKVMISGGGTGGHIFPAIAIANAIRAAVPDARFLFVGALGKMEMKKVPEAGFEIVGLPIRGFQRGSILKNLSLPFRLIASLWKARCLLRTFAPDVVVGVGGYASGPLLAVAQRMRIPTVIQEQNSHAGATNRMLARRADRICVAYEGMDRYFPKEKILLTGNPVRNEVVRLQGKRPRGLEHFGLTTGRPIVLITGGSLGARGINKGMLNALPKLKGAGVQVIWQTGMPFLAEAEEAVAAQRYGDCKVRAFLDRMDLAYAVADLVVARAGASSVSELCLVELPAILVPLPTAAEDHQTRNARALSDRGAAILMSDADAPTGLGDRILGLLNDQQALLRLRKNMLGSGRANAGEAIAAEVIRTARA